jgi:hypothetical protein
LVFDVDQCVGGSKIDARSLEKMPKRASNISKLLLMRETERLQQAKITDLLQPSKV